MGVWGHWPLTRIKLTVVPLHTDIGVWEEGVKKEEIGERRSTWVIKLGYIDKVLFTYSLQMMP